MQSLNLMQYLGNKNSPANSPLLKLILANSVVVVMHFRMTSIMIFK